MYQSHFGLTGAPFSLNPDPSFFFESRGHGNALSYLKFGVYQSEGFVVVTGEIGAGKTTLVRTLLSELDEDRIVAAQIVSTQLEAGDLLRSVAIAFGIAPQNLSKAELIATIEAFLTLQVSENKRALLIVDEAQNLDRRAVEELRMLSNFQLGNQALLQSFLVGQPELRTLLTSKPMEQFRQRVIASCHLGPMDGQETRAYIEHRLRQVGWTGRPDIDAAAHERIFQWTLGIPRRVNLLCNRLLLSAYLASDDHVGATTVDKVARELRSEVGESAVVPFPAASAPADDRRAAAAAIVRRSDAPTERPQVDAAPAAPPRSTAAVQPPASGAQALSSPMAASLPLVCIAASPLEDIELAVLLQALRKRGLKAAVRVRMGAPGEFMGNDAFIGRLELDVPVHQLEIGAATPTDQIALALQRLAHLIDEHGADAMVVAGDSDAALAAALVAAKQGVRLVHVDAASNASSPLNGTLIDRIASVFYPRDNRSYLSLIRNGADEDAVQPAGSLLMDALPLAHGDVAHAAGALRQGGLPLTLEARRGHGLVHIVSALATASRETVLRLLASLNDIGLDAPLLWPMPVAMKSELDARGLLASVDSERLAIVEPLGFDDWAALLRSARVVVTDSRDVQELAAAMQGRSVALTPGELTPSERAVTAPRAGAAADLAAHLLARLHGPVKSRLARSA